jgi:hypothetical protein
MLGGPGGVEQLLLLEVVVAAQQHQTPALSRRRPGLDLSIGCGDLGVGFGKALIVRRPGVGNRSRSPGSPSSTGPGPMSPFQVRPVVAGLTGDDPVLTGVAADDELDRLRATHRTRRCLDVDRIQAHPGEDPLVGVVVLLEARVEPGQSMSRVYESFMVNSRTRSRPDLGRGSSRNLVCIWYQIWGSSSVGEQLGSEHGEDLLFGHAQDQIDALAVLERKRLSPIRS